MVDGRRLRPAIWQRRDRHLKPTVLVLLLFFLFVIEHGARVSMYGCMEKDAGAGILMSRHEQRTTPPMGYIKFLVETTLC